MAAATVGVKLVGETRARLEKLGDAGQRSTHRLVKEAIARDRETEERYDLERAEDLARWRRYVETGGAVPHEEAAIRLKGLAHAAAGKTGD